MCTFVCKYHSSLIFTTLVASSTSTPRVFKGLVWYETPCTCNYNVKLPFEKYKIGLICWSLIFWWIKTVFYSSSHFFTGHTISCEIQNRYTTTNTVRYYYSTKIIYIRIKCHFQFFLLHISIRSLTKTWGHCFSLNRFFMQLSNQGGIIWYPVRCSFGFLYHLMTNNHEIVSFFIQADKPTWFESQFYGVRDKKTFAFR